MAFSITLAQALLYEWFCARKKASIIAIHNAVDGLHLYDLTSPLNVYTVFYPLVRKGLVEFAGNGAWIVSPPQILVSPTTSYYALISNRNVPIKALDDLKIFTQNVSMDLLGSMRFCASHENVQKWADKYGVQLIYDACFQILKNLPSISAVYSRELTEEPYPGTPECVWEVGRCDWVSFNSGDITAGYYKMRKEPYSKRFLYDGKKWFRMRSPFFSPDAEHIARWASYIYRKNQLIEYNHKTKTLSIQKVLFPLLVERALNSISYTVVGCADQHSHKFPYVTGKHLSEIKRIFSPKLVKER